MKKNVKRLVKIFVFTLKGGSGKSTLVSALARTLKNACIVDNDLQKTLVDAGNVFGHQAPVPIKEIRGDYAVFDTPPYNEDGMRSILKEADVIIVPLIVSFSDLLRLDSTVKALKKAGALKKAVVVLNRVRKPRNTTYFKAKEGLEKNYPELKVAKTELSQLRSFDEVLVQPLYGQALQEMKRLIDELL